MQSPTPPPASQGGSPCPSRPSNPPSSHSQNTRQCVVMESNESDSRHTTPQQPRHPPRAPPIAPPVALPAPAPRTRNPRRRPAHPEARPTHPPPRGHHHPTCRPRLHMPGDCAPAGGRPTCASATERASGAMWKGSVQRFRGEGSLGRTGVMKPAIPGCPRVPDVRPPWRQGCGTRRHPCRDDWPAGWAWRASATRAPARM